MVIAEAEGINWSNIFSQGDNRGFQQNYMNNERIYKVNQADDLK